MDSMGSMVYNRQIDKESHHFAFFDTPTAGNAPPTVSDSQLCSTKAKKNKSFLERIMGPPASLQSMKKPGGQSESHHGEIGSCCALLPSVGVLNQGVAPPGRDGDNKVVVWLLW